MKSEIRYFAIVLFGLLLSLVPMLSWTDPSPCEQIKAACGEAGFTQDVPAGKDLLTRCYDPLLQGQDVPGVKVDPVIVKQCKAQQSVKPQRKKKWG